MSKYVVSLIHCFIFIALFMGVGKVVAIDDQYPNNKFGIHLAQPSDEDIDRAAELVNSSGGTWGYVTLVIQENDRDVQKWQDIFDKLRDRRLIPIIRLATVPDGAHWKVAQSNDAREWVDFLNSLRWVVKNRYIILFNEPNHGQEWGGFVDPQEYATVAERFAQELKERNSDFFVMMAGLDLAAPSARPGYEDAAVFMREIVEEIGVDDFNKYFDGLASHSYPNPGFIGSPVATGRTSVRGYEWEQSFLQNLGIQDVPVFITETGWDGDILPRTQIAENFHYVFQNIWLPDDRVIAVTPFILNYQGEPFLKFSWVKPGNVGVYPEFGIVQGIAKERGRPDIVQNGSINFDLPQDIVEQSTYHFQIELVNTGEAIWSSEDGYSLELEGIPNTQYLLSVLGEIKPGDTKMIDVYFSTTNVIGQYKTSIVLYRDEEPVLRSGDWQYTVVPLPSLTFHASLLPKFKTTDEGFELQVFDRYEQLVFRKKDLSVERGQGSIDKVENIALGEPYRVVLLKKYYLPRQTFVTFQKGENVVTFERMLPFDFSGDGALRFGDVTAFFQHLDLTRLLLP